MPRAAAKKTVRKSAGAVAPKKTVKKVAGAAKKANGVKKAAGAAKPIQRRAGNTRMMIDPNCAIHGIRSQQMRRGGFYFGGEGEPTAAIPESIPAPEIMPAKKTCSGQISGFFGGCPIGHTCENGFCEPRTSCSIGRFCPSGKHCTAYFGSGTCVKD